MPDYKTLFQPTQPQTGAPPQVLTPNQLYSREYAQSVGIPLAQNVLGGLGVCGLVLAVGLRAGGSIDNIGLWALFAGALVTCTATAVRAFRDEVRLVIAAYGERQDKATRLALTAEVEQYKREIAALRSQGVVQAKYLAMQAAERLLGDYYERHLDIHRAQAMQRGYSRPTWDAAMKVLRTAGVVNGKGDVLSPSYPEAWGRVLRTQQGGMGSFAVTESGDVIRKA